MRTPADGRLPVPSLYAPVASPSGDWNWMITLPLMGCSTFCCLVGRGSAMAAAAAAATG